MMTSRKNLEESLINVRAELNSVNAQLDARKVARLDAVKQIKQILATHRITREELAAELACKPAKPSPSLLFRAKYRDTETGNAWSGTGETPSWLKRLIAQGRSLNEFLVE